MNKFLKKVIYAVLIFLMSITSSCAIEEIVLEEEKNEHLNLDYLSDVYYGKVENAQPVLKLFSQDGLKFENLPINSVKAHFFYASSLSYANEHEAGAYAQHRFGNVEPMLSVDFNKNRSQFMIDYNILRNFDGYSNDFTQKISQLYVSHKITPNQTFLLGQSSRVPSTYDGSRSVYNQDLVLKSQFGRTFGDRRSVGIRNIASYKYLDYDIGFYDSTSYMKEFGKGTDFTGYVMLKPFSESEESKKNIKIGAGYSTGKNDISYNTYSVYAGYDYKKFHIHAEYANSDGYNGIYESNNKADGFYSLMSYEITPKLHLIGRYDNYTGNKHKSSIYTNEYTAGITYKPYKNLKVLLNYVRRVNSNSPDSDMILFATRFII